MKTHINSDLKLEELVELILIEIESTKSLRILDIELEVDLASLF
jgi:hypothetical protein